MERERGCHHLGCLFELTVQWSLSKGCRVLGRLRGCISEWRQSSDEQFHRLGFIHPAPVPAGLLPPPPSTPRYLPLKLGLGVQLLLLRAAGSALQGLLEKDRGRSSDINAARFQLGIPRQQAPLRLHSARRLRRRHSPATPSGKAPIFRASLFHSPSPPPPNEKLNLTQKNEIRRGECDEWRDWRSRTWTRLSPAEGAELGLAEGRVFCGARRRLRWTPRRGP